MRYYRKPLLETATGNSDVWSHTNLHLEIPPQRSRASLACCPRGKRHAHRCEHRALPQACYLQPGSGSWFPSFFALSCAHVLNSRPTCVRDDYFPTSASASRTISAAVNPYFVSNPSGVPDSANVSRKHTNRMGT